MSNGSGLVQQKITVHLAGREDEPLVVTTANPDLVRWDMTRSKHGWPAMEDAPMLWATFVAWAAAKRTGAYDQSWDQWSNHDALSVEFDAEGVEQADPTQTEA